MHPNLLIVTDVLISHLYQDRPQILRLDCVPAFKIGAKILVARLHLVTAQLANQHEKSVRVQQRSTETKE